MRWLVWGLTGCQYHSASQKEDNSLKPLNDAMGELGVVKQRMLDHSEEALREQRFYLVSPCMSGRYPYHDEDTLH